MRQGAPSHKFNHPDRAKTEYRDRIDGNRVRRRRSRTATRPRRHRLRSIYFGIASFWGFLIGALALLSFIARSGRPIGDPLVAGSFLMIGALLAVCGGVVAAWAYGSHDGAGRD